MKISTKRGGGAVRKSQWEIEEKGWGLSQSKQGPQLTVSLGTLALSLGTFLSLTHYP